MKPPAVETLAAMIARRDQLQERIIELDALREELTEAVKLATATVRIGMQLRSGEITEQQAAAASTALLQKIGETQ